MRQRHPSIADGTWWRQDWWIGKQINRNNRTEDTERRKNGSYIKEHEWCETEQEYVTCEITVPREDDRRNETESLFKGMYDSCELPRHGKRHQSTDPMKPMNLKQDSEEEIHT